MDETPPLEISIYLFTHLFYTTPPGVETIIAVFIFIYQQRNQETDR